MPADAFTELVAPPAHGRMFTRALRTFCSGLGRMWAERRTVLTRAGVTSHLANGDGAGGKVEAVSLWVHLDRTSWRPKAFSEQELAVYGDAADGRRVSARLRHPPPESAQTARSWRFRATERDLAGHINNAAYWQPLEEELLDNVEPNQIDAEIEYRTPSQPGEMRVLQGGNRRWIVNRERKAHASILLAGATPPSRPG